MSPTVAPERAPLSPFAPHSVRHPVMYQDWENLTFLHWPYDPDAIRRLLPRGIELDTFRGAAWVGLVPFEIANLRPPFVPALPWISRFPETNVRTYVRGPRGKRGVYFFTLDADRWLAVVAARLGYRLPYRWARMQVSASEDSIRYQSKRPAAYTDIQVAPGAAIEAGEFDHFLTARFSLITEGWGRVLAADIEHPPWPLQSAVVTRLEQNLIESCGIPSPNGAPIVHFARRVHVRVARIKAASTK